MTFHITMEENSEKDRDKITEGEGESRSCSAETSLDTQGMGSIPSQRTKVPQATKRGQIKNKIASGSDA